MEMKIRLLLKQVYNKRRKKFCFVRKGFIHEVFNLCCKYNVNDFWHGKLPIGVDPKQFIKKKVEKYNLSHELEIARKKSYAFADLYLQNRFLYQDNFHLIEPFKTFNFFNSTRARSLMIKVLLYPRIFKVYCDLCNEGFTNIFDHHIYDCIYLKNQRHTLRNMLFFYNFPNDIFLDKKNFLSACLEKKSWTKCLTDFFEDASQEV